MAVCAASRRRTSRIVPDGDAGLDRHEPDEIGADHGRVGADDRFGQRMAMGEAGRGEEQAERAERQGRLQQGEHAEADQAAGDEDLAGRQVDRLHMGEGAERHADDPRAPAARARRWQSARPGARPRSARRDGRGRESDGRGLTAVPRVSVEGVCAAHRMVGEGRAGSQHRQRPGRRFEAGIGKGGRASSLSSPSQAAVPVSGPANAPTDGAARCEIARTQPPSEHPVRRAHEKQSRRQVSWLAGPGLSPPSRRAAPVADGEKLTAYSCGGSRGVSPRSLFTPLPGHRRSQSLAICGRLCNGARRLLARNGSGHGDTLPHPGPRRRALRQEPPCRADWSRPCRRPGPTSRPRRPGTRKCGSASPSIAPAARRTG